MDALLITPKKVANKLSDPLIPPHLVGCWKLISGPPGSIDYIGFSENAVLFVTMGPRSFEVSNNGKEMKLWRHWYDRSLGQGKTYLGEWSDRNTPEEKTYFAKDGNSLWHDSDEGARGVHSLISGDMQCGKLESWERRGCVSFDEVSGIYTLQTDWGYRGSADYVFANDQLSIHYPTTTFVYERSSCNVVFW